MTTTQTLETPAARVDAGPTTGPRPRRRAWLFPDPPRHLPGEEAVRLLLRTVHLGAMAVLVGGHFFDTFQEELYWPLLVTIASGVLMLALRVYGSLGWLFRVRGVLSVGKTALLLLVPVYWDQRIWVLMAVLVLGSISAHLPKRIGCFSLLTGAPRGVDPEVA